MDHMRRAYSCFQTAAAAFIVAMMAFFALSGPVIADEAEDMDALFAELAETEGEEWMRAESDIERIWTQTGSASLDFLLMRGEAALDTGDPLQAIGHLTALTENAPEFAPGWAARGFAFYLAGQTGPALSDVAQALALEPRHWHSLTLLATILEETGSDERALSAYRASLAINPHQEEAEDGVARLTTAKAGQDA